MSRDNVQSQKLIEQYLPLAEKIANRVSRNVSRYFERDDLLSFAFIGLVDAIKKYDKKKSLSFQCYAYMRIKGSIYDGLRREGYLKKLKDHPEPIRPISLDDLPENLLANVEHEHRIEKQLNALSVKSAVSRVLEGMPDQMKQLIVMYYYQGETFSDISKKMNLSKSWVSRLHQQALIYLGHHMKKCKKTVKVIDG